MKTFGMAIPAASAMVAVSYLPTLALAPVLLLGLLLSLALVLLVVWRWPSAWCCKARQFYFPIALGGCLGGCVAYFLCHSVLQQLPSAHNGKVFELSGHIIGIPVKTASRFNPELDQWRFDLLVQSAELIDSSASKQTKPALVSNHKLQLTWVNRESTSDQWVAPGSAVTLNAKLSAPRGLVNPVGFDYQRWLLSSGYSAVGSVKAYSTSSLVEHSAYSWMATRISLMRWNIRQRLLSGEFSNADGVGSDNRQTLGGLLAIALGDKSLLDDQQWQKLRDTGTIHLLIVSGMHVSIVAGIGFWLGGLLAKIASFWRPRYWLEIPTLCSVSLATFYAALAGFSMPTQRALVMVVIANLFWLWGWQRRPWVGFWLAMIVVLCLDPLAGHSGGFWLSFTVVAIILTLLPQANRARLWARGFNLQIWLFAAMLLPIALVTGNLNFLSPVVNLMAIPYVSLLLVPVTLLAVLCALLPSFGEIFVAVYWLAQQLMAGFWLLLDLFNRNQGVITTMANWLNSSPFAVNQISLGLWLLLFIMTLGAVLPILPRYSRYLCFGSLVVLVTAAPKQSPVLRFTVLDVGQGTSHFVEFGDQVLVFDTGPQFSQEFQAAADILVPVLKARGVRILNHLVVSHGDADHASGLDELSREFVIGKTHSGEPERLPLASTPCRAGVKWNWQHGGIPLPLQFEYLWPKAATGVTDSANNRSCVLLIRWGTQSILLTGDISKEVEWKLTAAQVHPVDVLVAPHHGSKTSSSHRFIAALQPSHVVFSAGYNNRFGHPNTGVLQRYRELSDASLWNTATHGAIQFEWNREQQLRVVGWRQWRQRFWY